MSTADTTEYFRLPLEPDPKKCQCGHSKYVHKGCFKGGCVKPGCDCQRYMSKAH